jgi:membrane carboxypeptidase/penicillin-binding protein
MVGLVLLAFSPYAYLDYRVYWRHRSQIVNELATMPEQDKHPPAAVLDMVERFFGTDRIDSLVARDLQYDLDGADRHLVRALREFSLTYSLKVHLSRQERLALFCHHLRFDGGAGLSAGAARYYSKEPIDLTKPEIAGLIASDWRGDYASPFKHPDHFESVRQRVLAYPREK